MSKSRRRSRPSPALLPAVLGLLGWLLVTFAVAYWGSQFRPGDWYSALVKPSWTPPNWVFAPVWTALYFLMALAAWLVWRNFGWRGARVALVMYVLQLAANGAWSWLFFGRHEIASALLDIVILLVLVIVTTVLFRRRSPAAGMLLIPYVIWVAYATTLNFGIWRMN